MKQLPANVLAAPKPHISMTKTKPKPKTPEAWIPPVTLRTVAITMAICKEPTSRNLKGDLQTSTKHVMKRLTLRVEDKRNPLSSCVHWRRADQARGTGLYRDLRVSADTPPWLFSLVSLLQGRGMAGSGGARLHSYVSQHETCCFSHDNNKSHENDDSEESGWTQNELLSVTQK